MNDWVDSLRSDPLPWLLEGDAPAVRHLALRDLVGLPADDPELVAARRAGTAAGPIARILAAQDPEGWWVVPGCGYLPKYTATTWQVSFLEQMGADPDNAGVRRACEYVIAHAQTTSGAFGVTLKPDRLPPPSGAIHCLNGNLVRALLGFGWGDDERVGRAVTWHASIVNGTADVRFYQYVPAPGFVCGANGRYACAWGATKAVAALARVPASRRTEAVSRALQAGVEFLLRRDPAVADYPTATPGARPNGSWFKLGFPSGYVTDVLGVLEAVCAAGAAGDERLTHAVEWLLSRQDEHGRWPNEYPYTGKMLVDLDRRGAPSKWVTLRACRVLRAVAAAH